MSEQLLQPASTDPAQNMRHPVVDNAYLEESLADFAVVGLVSVVDAEHVLLEVGQLRERLVAQLAHVRLLA